MPFYTDAEIEQRKAAAVKMNRLNCGWNLPTELTAAITARLATLEPATEAGRRDKRILELAFIHDMNPQQIARLNDPEFIGMGNRSRGKPLSAAWIYQICMDFAPEVAEYRKTAKEKRRPDYDRRISLYKRRQAGEIEKPNVCATCGSKTDIEQHHIIPIAAGGTDDYFNLISLCHDCHMNLHHRIYDRLQWKD